MHTIHTIYCTGWTFGSRLESYKYVYAWYAFILSKWNIEVSFSLSSSSPCSGSRYVIPLILFETWEKQLLLTIFSNQYLCTLGSSFGIMCAVTSILYTHHVMFLWSVRVASCTTVAVVFTSWSWMIVAWVTATFSTIMAVFTTAASRRESGLGYYVYYDYSGNQPNRVHHCEFCKGYGFVCYRLNFGLILGLCHYRDCAFTCYAV